MTKTSSETGIQTQVLFDSTVDSLDDPTVSGCKPSSHLYCLHTCEKSEVFLDIKREFSEGMVE